MELDLKVREEPTESQRQVVEPDLVVGEESNNCITGQFLAIWRKQGSVSALNGALIFIKFVLLQYPKINNLISKIEKNTQEHVADSNIRSIYYWDMYIL